MALPLNFHFIVEFDNPDYSADRHFRSVEGLQAGLWRDDEMRIAPSPQFDLLVLKRAYNPDSKLLEWCMKAINKNERVEEKFIIKLLDAQHGVKSAWIINDAVPVGWGVDELHAEHGAVLEETITLKYKFFEVTNSQGRIIAPKEDD